MFNNPKHNTYATHTQTLASGFTHINHVHVHYIREKFNFSAKKSREGHLPGNKWVKQPCDINQIQDTVHKVR
jgi:hypothetical protein